MADDLYQDRVLIYIDILGWSTACRDSGNPKLRKALKVIHREAETYSEAFRKGITAQDATITTELGTMPIQAVNPMFLQVQFGAFSDHFVFSMPASFGSRILNVGNMIRSLLLLGFATRGAVVRGPLYHLDNVIFGPALIEAVNIESTEAVYPRVIVAQALLDWLREIGHLDGSAWGYLVEDHLHRMVVNPFPLGLSGPPEVIDSSIRENFALPEIKAIIEHEIADHEVSGNKKYAEKWHYLRDFISGPIIAATPQMGAYWRSPVDATGAS